MLRRSHVQQGHLVLRRQLGIDGVVGGHPVVVHVIGLLVLGALLGVHRHQVFQVDDGVGLEGLDRVQELRKGLVVASSL